MPALTCYRLKAALESAATPDFDDYVSDDRDFTTVGPVSYPSFEAKLFFATSPPREPSWGQFLAGGLRVDIDWPQIRSASALLIVRIPPKRKPKYFAFTFGIGGRFLLKEDSYIRSYGLRAALNVMYPTGSVAGGSRGLRTVGSKRHGSTLMRQRAQSSALTTIEAFNIDRLRDLVWEVDGVPADTNTWGTRIAGGDAFATSYGEVEFNALGEICRNIDGAASLTDYKFQFSFIDHIRPVTDPRIASQLQDRVVDLVRTTTAGGGLHLAPPTIVDWMRIDRFQYPFDVRKKIYHPDLRLQDFQAVLRREQKLDQIDLEGLRRPLVVFDADGQRTYRWTVWSCITGEIEFNGRTFVLDEGAFYEVEKQYLTKLNSWVDALEVSSISLPDHHAGDREDEYNKRVATQESLLLLDQKTVQLPGETPVELCDLLTKDRKFIHVKKNSGSRDLSHLFSQALVPAALLQDDAEFQQATDKHIRKLTHDSAFHFFNGLWEPRLSEIVYAIIDPRWASGASKVLPFFSKVNLQRHVRDLQSRGYSVRLGPIGLA